MRRPVEVLVAILLLAGAMCGPAASQTAVIDTLELVPLPPDSMYLRRDGAEIVIGWYPPPDSTGAGIGSYDFRNWFGVHSVNEGSRVTLSGAYIGNVDLTLKFEKVFPSTAPVVIGGSSPADTSIRISLSQMGSELSTRVAACGSAPFGASTRCRPKRSPFTR